MSRFVPWVLSSVDHGTQLLCTVGCAVSWRVPPCSGSFFKGFDGMGPLKTHIMSHPPGASLISEALLCAHCPPGPTWTPCRNRWVWVLLLPSGDLGACVASVFPSSVGDTWRGPQPGAMWECWSSDHSPVLVSAHQTQQ